MIRTECKELLLWDWPQDLWAMGCLRIVIKCVDSSHKKQSLLRLCPGIRDVASGAKQSSAKCNVVFTTFAQFGFASASLLGMYQFYKEVFRTTDACKRSTLQSSSTLTLFVVTSKLSIQKYSMQKHTFDKKSCRAHQIAHVIPPCSNGPCRHISNNFVQST